MYCKGASKTDPSDDLQGKTATKLAPTGDLGFASLDEIWMLLSDIWALASVFMLVLVSLLVYFWNQVLL